MDAAAERHFHEFVVARSPALMRLAYLLTGGDQQTAEDLLQVALVKTAARWRTIEDPDAYVRRVMYHQQVSWWRLRWPRRETPWAYLTVAPGLRQAAVLEGPLPAARVGLLDTRTRKVTRWIPLDHRAGGLSWSADGRRLLVTAYAQNPDLANGPRSSTRTGFSVVDVKTGRPGPFRALPPVTNNPNTRQDLGWSRTGTLIWSPTGTVPNRTFYDLRGRPQAAPPHEAEGDQEAGLSPNGRYVADHSPGSGPGPLTAVKDVTTGRTAGLQPVEQLRAWADDGHLIALACEPKACMGKGEFHNRLVLVSVDGRKITPLTGYQHSDRSGAWVPVFTPR